MAQVFKDIMVSDYLREKGCGILAIEPMADEHWDENGYYITLKYAVLPMIDPNSPESTTCPARWIIKCDKKIILSKVGEDVIQLLRTTMAQDLRIRYFNEQENPVCISVIINNREIAL